MNNIIKKSLAFVFAVLMIFSAFNVAENYSPLTAYAASSISIKKTPALKASKVKAKSVKLSWSKVKKATKYEIYRSTDKKNWKLVKTTDKTSVTIKKLKTGKTYYFKVRALTKKKTGVFSKVKKVTPKPYKVKGINATFKNSKKVTLTWKKSKGATHYQIVYSTDSKFKENKKVKTVKADKLSYTLKKLKANTSYFVKVRAINKNYKKTAKGKYSTKLELVTETKTIYTYKKTKVYATTDVNIRKGPSATSDRVGGLRKDQSITRIATGDNGWSKVSLNGTTAYIMTAYLTTKKPVVATTAATTTTKAPTTTKKQETTTKPATTTKPTESTTKKTETSVTQTSGGIKLKPVTSAEAKKIESSFATLMKFQSYEGKSADGKNIVVYAKTSDGWLGIDKNGAYYNSSGEKKVCEYCGLTKGRGSDKCLGQCVMSFH